MRLLAALLVVAGLLWWLLQEDDSARRERSGESAISEVVRETTESAAETESEQADRESQAQPEKIPQPIRAVRGRVQVRGRNDAPLAGVTFKSEPESLKFTGPTDALGWTDWTSKSELPADLVIVDSFLRRKHAVKLPITTIRFPDLIPLEVEFIDIGTGVVLEEGSISLATDRGQTVHGRTIRTLVHAPIVPGEVCNFLLHLDPPEGLTGEMGLHQQVTCFVSHRAHAAHLRIPLWPEMRLMLEFRDSDGTPASGIQIEHVVFPFRPIRIQAKPSDANGRTVVEGMPFLERAIISILASGRAYETRIRRRDQYTRLSRSRSFNDWIGLQDLPLTNVPEREPVRAIGTGELGVEPRWGDRERAEGVDIAMQWGTHIQRARSETGVVVFRMLPKGEGRIAVLDPALAYEERPVSLREGGKLTVTLGPAQGRSMTFVVQGRKPVAGARILASAWHGLIAPPIIDGVQQLAAVTGPGGVYVWHGFPLEEAKITAFRGGWSGEGRVGRGIRGERASVTLRPRRK